jgi:anti-anti-sigma factor
MAVHGTAGARPVAPVVRVTTDVREIVFLSGDMDLVDDLRLEEALRSSMDDRGSVFVDAEDLTFIGSTGVRTVLDAAGDQPDGCMIIHGVSATVREAFEVAGSGDVPGLHLVSIVACKDGRVAP